jgi:hypothetical protein
MIVQIQVFSSCTGYNSDSANGSYDDDAGPEIQDYRYRQ